MSPNQKSAPFTAEEVEALNAFQTLGGYHPFTCGNDRSDAEHRAYQKVHGGDLGQLVAKEDGWHCPVCGYHQNWTHKVMIEIGAASLKLQHDKAAKAEAKAEAKAQAHDE